MNWERKAYFSLFAILAAAAGFSWWRMIELWKLLGLK